MMNRNPFRLSTILALAVATTALGTAEATIFPEIGGLAVALVVGFYAIYRLDSRSEPMSIASANLLGIAIALGYLLWASYRALRIFREDEFAALGWQLMTLPIFAPILMLAVPAKLLRADKTVRDWWMIQWIGLAQVAVAGTIGDVPAVFALIGLYGVFGVWSLLEFYRERHRGTLSAPSTLQPRPVPMVNDIAEERLATRLARTVTWAGIAAAFGVLMFLITPRSTAERLQFGNPRVEVGFASNQMVDLRRTVDLQDNPDPVFEVRAEFPDGRPKADLGGIQRWRGTTLSRYSQGLWVPERNPLPTSLERATNNADDWEPPDFGPQTFRLHFTMLIEERASFLAEPVLWLPNQPVPVASFCASGMRGWNPSFDGTGSFMRMQCSPPRLSPRRYVQYTMPAPDPDLGPAFQLSSVQRPEDVLRELLANYPSRVREYADRLMLSLIDEGKLPADAMPTSNPKTMMRRVPDRHQEAVARAFARHLATDPAYRYTTQLQRGRTDSDPIEEFLWELKAGHCERFAAALVMMLRAEGIPAVLVLGFRGSEPLGDGRWLVRQRDAHAWVEVLISRSTKERDAGEPRADWHWLSLDPTPDRSDDTAAVQAKKPFWQRSLDWLNGQFVHYFVNYTPERRDQALRELRGFALSWPFLSACGFTLGASLLARRLRRKIQTSVERSEPSAWYEQLVNVLARHGYPRLPEQTPREFGTAVSVAFGRRPGLVQFAELPLTWANAFYRMRYGDVFVANDERAELERQLAALNAVLKKG